MNIYSILSSKPHNPHYLNRYIKFIQSCQIKNIGYEGYLEKHHICPKAKDMFPEYSSLKENQWNCAKLTPRQHFIAHIILWKSYLSVYSVSASLWSMKHKNKTSINSRIYQSLKERFYNKEVSGNNKNKFWITNGKDNMMIPNNSIMPEGYYRGKVQPNQTKSVSGTIFINNGVEVKRIPKTENIPEGWEKGMLEGWIKPFKYITNGKISKKISPNAPIPDGFRCGMASRKKNAAIN